MPKGKRVGKDAVQVTVRVPGKVASQAAKLVRPLRAKGFKENSPFFRATRADVFRLAIERGLELVAKELGKEIAA